MSGPFETKEIILHCILPFLPDEDAVRFLRIDHYRYTFISSYVFGSNRYYYSKIPPLLRTKRFLRHIFFDVLDFADFCFWGFNGLRHIDLPACFNRSLPSFPRHIESIHFGMWFNQPVNGLFEYPYLKKLTFGSKFNQPLTSAILPSSLEILHLNFNFNHPLDSLPGTLKILTIDSPLHQSSFEHNVSSLPSELHFLRLCVRDNYKWSFTSLPLNLRRLELHGFISKIDLTNCYSLETFLFGEFVFMDQSIDNLLPSQLKELIFSHAYNTPIHQLPKGLEVIRFGESFNQEITALKDCPFLRTVTFGHRFNKPIYNLPDQIRTIRFGCHFNKNLRRLPSHLQYLTLGHQFSCSLSPVSPDITLNTNVSICSLHERRTKSRYLQEMEQTENANKKQKITHQFIRTL